MSIGLGVALLFGSTTPAEAQPRGGGMMMGMGRLTEPDVSSKDIESYAALLSLTEEQKAAANELLLSYQQEFSALAEQVRQIRDGARQEFEETRDPAVWQDLMPRFEELGEEKKALESSFLEDFRLLLTPEQDALWPKLERMRRRDRTLSQGGIVSGETVDLFKVIEESKLSEETTAALSAVLEQYEMDLDRALIERNETYETGMARGMQNWRDQDFESMEENFAKARDAAIKLRDINRKYARQIEGLLPEESRAEFNRKFKEASFPRVYAKTYVTRAFEATDGFEDLTAEQREQIRAMREAYTRELNAINEKMAAAIEEGELTRGVRDMMGMGPGGGNEATREGREARRELDRATEEKLRALLTEEQQARLPERPSQNWREGGQREERTRRMGEREERPREL